ncbi:hypothetical protein BHU72_08615 [Desulfuribacillus stibiiarsenatis]|uniref:Aminotransferase class V domain-containing protein n=1 Tax=Desulfuribacillus stibiiarsenatis TaxID=1390249 RepID=A0A1E5L343_9FIRM|nr:aminotransferase class V-fold PLP-dependent enzyme [Desulfuribacillus stibiiarsenatis]OEH84560.1 hypothetical protein BHU72_08615 [Desulfuribacillus stibiiarsenatis]
MDIDFFRYETLGYGSFMIGPFGKRLITYADYTASGKCLRFLENYYWNISESYANTHTEDDYTGKYTTELYNDAINKIRKLVRAGTNYSIIATGTGATGAIDKLSKILGIYKTPEYWRRRSDFFEKPNLSAKEKAIVQAFDKKFDANRPVVFISAYEHHSNELQWREGHAEVVKIGLDTNGLFDLNALKKHVSNPLYKHRMKIGSFSAASNVTGIKSPMYEIARIMHQYGGYVFFDFAASGPYVEIHMTKDNNCYFDGIYLSMHKFLGGPNSSGILIINNAIYNNQNSPTTAGGGTVRFVTNYDQEYLDDLERRETAGTPGIMQGIRAAMALELKHQIGEGKIEDIESVYIKKAFAELSKFDNIVILGNQNPINRIAIMSFLIRYKNGFLHHGFVSKLLSDLFGIQSRAGCDCAGPYGAKLLNLSYKKLERIREAIHLGHGAMKPGWTRVNFHYTLDQATFDYMIAAIQFVAVYGHQFLQEYLLNPTTGCWTHRNETTRKPVTLSFLDAIRLKRGSLKTKRKNYARQYRKYLLQAQKIKNKLPYTEDQVTLFGQQLFPDIAWFYYYK